MINKLHMNGRKACAGAAAVEFAILLPVLLLLGLPVFDFARAIQADMIMVNMSREGASLAARTSWCTPGSGGCSNIMGPLTSTSPPLDMNNNGMIYITVVKGHSQGGNVRNVVQEQYMWWKTGWNVSHYAPTSSVWNCGASGTSWYTEADGTRSCSGINANDDSKPTATVMTGQLADADVVYAVEVFYNFNMLFGGMNLGPGIMTPQLPHDISAMTIL